MAKLILVRHGESVWNLENRFTGWIDVPLSPKGMEEAKSAGQKLQTVSLDIVFVSHLTRAIQTMHYILDAHEEKRTRIIYHDDDNTVHKREHYTGDHTKELPIHQSKSIAERYYGNLQGMNKDEARKQYGEDQVHIWRRSYDVPPPEGESLKDTLQRVQPYFEEYILKQIREGKNVLVVANGNSLRAMIKHLEHISDEEIPKLELATGVPIIYELDYNLNIISKNN